MKRIALFVVGIMAVSIGVLAQGRGPPPPPPRARRIAGRRRQGVDRRTDRSERPGDRDQMEARLHATKRSGRALTAWSATTGPAFPSSSRSRCSARASPTSTAWRRI